MRLSSLTASSSWSLWLVIGVGPVADRRDPRLLDEMDRVRRDPTAGQAQLVPVQLAVGVAHRPDDRFRRVDREGLGDRHETQVDRRPGRPSHRLDQGLQLRPDRGQVRGLVMPAGPGQLGPHGQPVRVVAGDELADEQRRLGIVGRGVREAIAQVGEGRVEDPPDLDRVDGPRRDHGLVDGRSVALDDDLPEAQAEAADRQVDAAAELAGDDGVTVDPASDQRVERLVAATLVHPVERHEDPAVARQAVGAQQPDGRHHRRIGALHVGRPAADEQVAVPLRRGVLDVDGIEMAVPLDGRPVARARARR